MIDIHPAPHAANTWREFFIHIITIVIGLLIALWLEQMVTSIHQRHQSHRLENSLRAESYVNRRVLQYDLISIDEVRRNIRLNMVNLDHSGDKPFTPIPPKHDTFLPVIDTAWGTSRDNGVISLLPTNVAENYWKVAFMGDVVAAGIQSLAVYRMKVNSLLHLHSDPSELTLKEKNDLLRAYSDEDQELGNLDYVLIGYNFVNEAALAGHSTSIDELAALSRKAQLTEGTPPPPEAPPNR